MGYLLPSVFLAAGILFALVEMHTLTFYLAGLSFAALLTALVAWVHPLEWWQASVVFAVAALVSLPLMHKLRLRMQGSREDPLADMDKGGIVTIVEAHGGRLKVSYRDSLWEAVWEGGGHPHVGQRAEVVAREGSRLRIKPAA